MQPQYSGAQELEGEKQLPAFNYPLHNHNLKYFLIRQMLEKKGVEEI
jgi:hypothetical protein